ncbi:flavin reductase (NADPH) isoform X2 [Orussus abietinus]|uniref:flavin reductase (NADPH) isoform X2 n=1 Tax=Orussus abietinus TaxID=222816 RepID=UPI000626467C|nr:flavin reductase (NADPH) isoform X2 [Orussus abietinus]
MKKIVIFGATGNTGLCALYYAVKKGLRNEVEAVVGDVVNAEQVSKAVSDREGVVVVLGTRNDLSPTTVLSEGLKNIVEAMKRHKVEKVSLCLSAFLFYEPNAVPVIFKDLNADHRRMLDIIKNSELKWIAVLPPHIADSPQTQYIVKYDESPGRVVSKHDLGAFLVDSLVQPEHYGKVCGITSHTQ